MSGCCVFARFESVLVGCVHGPLDMLDMCVLFLLSLLIGRAVESKGRKSSWPCAAM